MLNAENFVHMAGGCTILRYIAISKKNTILLCSKHHHHFLLGVLTQEAFPLWKNEDFYIDANYVQYLQSSGARVVPIK